MHQPISLIGQRTKIVSSRGFCAALQIPDKLRGTGTETMLRWLLFVGAIACQGIAAPDQVSAETRFALVIGNSAYVHTTPLANPRNDAELIAASPRRTSALHARLANLKQRTAFTRH